MFKVAQSQAHSAVDRFEDPIKMTEQGVRDLKNSLHEAMTSLAQVKAIAIRMRKDTEQQQLLAADYERKAMGLLQKMQAGELDSAEAERLAGEALSRKTEAENRAQSLASDQAKQEQMADQLQTKVEKLRREIRRYENELTTLRARAKTASSMKKVNQQLAGADASDTIAMLEKMRNKVLEEESLAQAYGEMNEVNVSLEEEIDKALAAPPSVETDALADLKKKMGIEG
jgi:phage shock protein A